MRYNELLESLNDLKLFDFSFSGDLTELLIDNGYELLGSGDYADVFSLPNENTVIKVRESVGKKPVSEIKFYKYCAKVSNPYLPRVGKINVIDDWYYVEIEKLLPITSEYESLIIKMLTKCMYCTDTEFTEYFQSLNINNLKIEMLLGLKKEIDNLIESLKINYSKYDFLNIDNYMMRGSQIVITDPIIS